MRAGLRLLQLRILHRAYYTRARLHCMGRAGTDRWLRGCGQAGTLVHTLWGCGGLQRYWDQIGGPLSDHGRDDITGPGSGNAGNLGRPDTA